MPTSVDQMLMEYGTLAGQAQETLAADRLGQLQRQQQIAEDEAEDEGDAELDFEEKKRQAKDLVYNEAKKKVKSAAKIWIKRFIIAELGVTILFGIISIVVFVVIIAILNTASFSDILSFMAGGLNAFIELFSSK